MKSGFIVSILKIVCLFIYLDVFNLFYSAGILASEFFNEDKCRDILIGFFFNGDQSQINLICLLLNTGWNSQI